MNFDANRSSAALLISPPAVPVYLNLDYQFVEVGEVAGYLRTCGIPVVVLDGSTGATSWVRVAALLSQPHYIMLIHATMDNYEAVERLVLLCRTLNPEVPIVVYGRLVIHARTAFEDLRVDALVLEPDWETALEAACAAATETAGPLLPVLAGCMVRLADGSYRAGGPGRRLPGTWALPDLDALPLEEYRRAQERGTGTHQAKPMELAIGMSRGCDDTCGYCPIPKVGGGSERFRDSESLDSVARFAASAQKKYGLQRLSAFAANFTKNSMWVEKFCEAMRRYGRDVAWGCVTSPALLDGPLLREMRAAGCDRIAIGVESLRATGRNHFSWRSDVNQIEELASRCRDAAVQLVGFIMVGVPSQSAQDVHFTLQTLDRVGIVPRPMIYTNYKALSTGLTGLKAFQASRLMPPSERRKCELSPHDVLAIILDWRKWTYAQASG